jgi:hypothetical protein
LQSNEPKRASLLVPIKRQARVVRQLASGESGWLPTAEHGGNDVGREQREMEEPSCVGGDEAMWLRDLVDGEAAIMKQLIADPVGSITSSDERPPM